MFFGTKSHYTILSNYVTIFEVDAEMSEIFTDFSREKSQKNSAHWLQWVRNYWYLRFSPKLVMFLQGESGFFQLFTQLGKHNLRFLDVMWNTHFTSLGSLALSRTTLLMSYSKELYSFLIPVKACLHIPTPSPSPSECPSKFNIVSMVTGSLTGRMASKPILPVKLPVTIGTILNFDGHSDGDGDGVGMCKQTLRK